MSSEFKTAFLRLFKSDLTFGKILSNAYPEADRVQLCWVYFGPVLADISHDVNQSI